MKKYNVAWGYVNPLFMQSKKLRGMRSPIEVFPKKVSNESTLQKYVNLDADLLQKAESSFELIVDLCQTWKWANLIQKVWIIKMITSELFVDHEKALHLAERELFREVRNMSNTVWLDTFVLHQTLARPRVGDDKYEF